MIHFTMILKDTVVTAIEVVSQPDVFLFVPDNEIIRKMRIHVCDNLTGEFAIVMWTKEQWQAVMFILANDDTSGFAKTFVDRCYKIANPAMNMLPKNCRFIA